MTTQIAYLFDPLCGWCYGASPAISRLANDPSITLTLQPTGLFSGTGARPMDVDFAAYAWSNDQRIERLTAQEFSDVYLHNVLEAGGLFDSGPATLALTAVHLTAPEQVLAALKAIQTLRYVEGKDNSDLKNLVKILERIGLNDAASRLASEDAELKDACRIWMENGRRMMSQFGANGVPALIVGKDSDQKLLNAGALFGDSDTLIQRLHAA